MASIANIVKVQIIRGSSQVPQEAFNIPCVFGPSDRFEEVIRYYESASDMLSDGFETSDPEYIHVQAIYSQPNPPDRVGVSKYTPPVAQVDTLSVSTLSSSHNYSFLMGVNEVTYTSGASDTQQAILSGLLDAIEALSPTNAPVSGIVSGSGSSAVLTLTATDPGTGISYSSVDPLLSHTNTTPNHSIVDSIKQTQAVDDSWYCVLVCSKSSSDILDVAAYVQTQQKIYITASQDPGILTSSTTDIASQLKERSYSRTAVIYSSDASTAPDAAWVGQMLPVTPGTGNWKFKTLVGMLADKLNATQLNNATNKNCNVFTEFGGLNITSPGISASGDFIDVVIFIDWLMSTMEVNVYQLLVNAQKIPFTDAGIATVELAVRQTLQEGEGQQGLAPGWSVRVPQVADISQADKMSRTLKGVSFNATLAGAINTVQIVGYVGV